MSTTPTQPPDESGPGGILFVNLGTPDAPTTPAVRRFLKQFLSDPNVVDFPRLPWWLILNLVILRIRPARSAKAYRKIWTENGSPLLVYSQALADQVGTQFNRDRVALAMTYGDPSIDSAIDSLVENGVRKLLVIPLYPQYSRTTTASVFERVSAKVASMSEPPALRLVNDYHSADGYIDALANRIRQYWRQYGRGGKLLMSFHGIPEKNTRQGDPYATQCRATANLLANALDLSDEDWLLAFQSRVGREQWLSPYTEDVVRQFGREGLSRLDVVCPGFAVDCLETLEEIAIQNSEFFADAGGGSLHYIPALNAEDDHANFFLGLAGQQFEQWTRESSDPVSAS